jgi:hypothetical protein
MASMNDTIRYIEAHGAKAFIYWLPEPRDGIVATIEGLAEFSDGSSHWETITRVPTDCEVSTGDVRAWLNY